jgi:hypothetical protein
MTGLAATAKPRCTGFAEIEGARGRHGRRVRACVAPNIRAMLALIAHDALEAADLETAAGPTARSSAYPRADFRRFAGERPSGCAAQRAPSSIPTARGRAAPDHLTGIACLPTPCARRQYAAAFTAISRDRSAVPPNRLAGASVPARTRG